jgi:hypothetical protein
MLRSVNIVIGCHEQFLPLVQISLSRSLELLNRPLRVIITSVLNSIACFLLCYLTMLQIFLFYCCCMVYVFIASVEISFCSMFSH